MKTRAIYLCYLFILIAVVTPSQAFTPLHSEDHDGLHPERSTVPFTELEPAPAGADPVAAILESAGFDFSFTRSIRDSLRSARIETVKQTIRRISRRAIRVSDRQLAIEVLSMLSINSLEINPEAVKTRIAPWEPIITKYSRKYGIDPNLVRAIIFAESSGNPDVVSYRGAMGLMQLMPETADFVGVADPFNPEQNIMGGIKYIAWLAGFASDENEAHILWAWHAGPAMPLKRILPETTRDFIIKVLAVKRRLDTAGGNNPV